MSIELLLTPKEISLLKQITKLEDDSEAITQAAREYLRISRLRELKTASGKVEFEENWQALEQLELDECQLPQ